MKADQQLEVRAFWDGEAGVWVAESDHIRGLVAEAETVEQLALKLESLIPELLELNAPELVGVRKISLKTERTLHAA